MLVPGGRRQVRGYLAPECELILWRCIARTRGRILRDLADRKNIGIPMPRVRETVSANYLWPAPDIVALAKVLTEDLKTLFDPAKH